VTGKDTLQHRGNEPGFYYGYIVVAAAFVIMVVSWGLYISYGIFFNPLVAEFGWSRAVTSGAYSLTSLIGGVLGIVMGGLTDRFGPRTVVTFCGVFLGLGYLLMSRIDTLWHLYVFYGVIVGIGMSGLWVPLLSSVARWFTGRRSLMTGIVISGLTVGQMIGPPVINRLIAVYDWRNAYVILGVVGLVSIVVAGLFMKRDRAGATGPLPERENGSGQGPASPGPAGYSLGEAVHTTQFWMTFVIFVCFGFSAYSLLVHLVPHITDLGISDASAANILAVNGGVGIIGNFVLGGIIGDRIGNRKAFIIGFVLAIASLAWLVPAAEPWLLYLFAVVFGLALGSMGTSESPLVARLFGLRAHGLIYGVIGLGFTAGGAVGPIVTGYIHDVTDSYRIAFMVCIALAIIGLLLVTVLRPTKKLGGTL